MAEMPVNDEDRACSVFVCECGQAASHVLDSRHAGGPVPAIRRRRKCNKCGHRFTTYETQMRPILLEEAIAKVRSLARQVLAATGTATESE